MRFIPYGNNPNVSATRNETVNVSMQVDSRGLPHIAYLTSKNGHNEINYKFWDGQQWTYYYNTIVGWSEENLISSSNALILGIQEKPYIVFGKSLPNNQSSLIVATTQENVWLLDELTVNYDVKWIGLLRYRLNLSSSSSSSSSYANEEKLFVVTYDSSDLRVYFVTSLGWELIGEQVATISDLSSLKIVNAGKYIGIAWQESSSAYYNFFDTSEETWLYVTAQKMTINGLVTIDVEGFYADVVGKLIFAVIITDHTTTTQIVNIVVDTNGTTNTYLIESEPIYVVVDNDYGVSSESSGYSSSSSSSSTHIISRIYVSSGYSDISVSLDSVTGFFNVIAFGGRLAKYVSNNGVSWSKTYESIEGISSGILPDTLILKSYNDVNNMAFSNMGGDVYCFVENNAEWTTTVYPDISVFNEQRFYLAQYQDGKLKGTDIPCTWWERVGDILRESKTRVDVIVTDGEDPTCYTSSSSSSSSELTTSSSSSSSGWFPVGSPFGLIPPGGTGYDAAEELAVYNNKLYALTSNNADPETAGYITLWVYDGLNWSNVSGNVLSAFYSGESLCVYNNGISTALYIGLGDKAGDANVYAYNGTSVFNTELSLGTTQSRIQSIASYNNNLYAGTYATGGSTARTYKSADGINWNYDKDFGDFSSNIIAIHNLIKYNGKLYAGAVVTSIASLNTTYVFVNVGGHWTISKIFTETVDTSGQKYAVRSMAVYNNKLYVGIGNDYHVGNADLWEFDGVTWSNVAAFSYYASHDYIDRIESLCTYNNKIYIGVGEHSNVNGFANVYTYDGTNIVLNHEFDPVTIQQVECLESFNGYLYAGLGRLSNVAAVWGYST